MQCPQCQNVVDPGAFFCGNCGFKLAVDATQGAPEVTLPAQPAVPEAAITSAIPAAPQALAVQDHSGKAIASLVLGVIGLPACLIPIIGIVFGILAIVFGTLSVHSVRKVLAIIGMALGVITILASLFFWVQNAKDLVVEQKAGTLPLANKGGPSDLQAISTPCYTTKIPGNMHLTQTAGSCTFLGTTIGGVEQEEVKVLQVPGLSDSNLATVAKADAANVVDTIAGGSIADQRTATFAGSQAYEVEIKSTDGSAGLISYIYNTTAQGNLVIVLHTQSNGAGNKYDLSSIESNWAWL